jgi:ATP adenylyltransferase
MVAPYVHVADLADLDEPTLLEMMCLLRDGQRVLAEAVRADGFNIGVNIGRCAGAGLPGHLHVHVVPRWNGDTNFMPVLGGVRVIPQSLEAVFDLLRRTGERMGLPPRRVKPRRAAKNPLAQRRRTSKR